MELRSARARIAAGLAATLALAGLVAVTRGPAARATQLVAATFTGPTNGISQAQSRGWSVGGNSYAADNSIPAMVDALSTGSVDRLRLTDTHMLETGYALYNVAQTTAGGLDVHFNVAMSGYGGTVCPSDPTDNYNYISTGGAVANDQTTCQADGFVLYLKDGRDNLTGGSSLGSAGGALGYSPLTGSGSPVSGLSGALLGVGLDAYGNFYQRPFSGSDCTDDPANAETYARRSLIVRGPQGDSRTTGYCRVVLAGEPTSGRNTGVSLSSFSSLFEVGGAAVRITVNPSDHTAGSHGTGTVYLASVGTADWSTVSALTTFALPQKLAEAPSFKFGFVGATGGGAMNLDIWGVTVDSLTSIPDPAITSPGTLCLTRGTSFHRQLVAHDGVAPYVFSVPTQQEPHTPLPSGVSLSAAGRLSGTPTTVGDYSTVVTVDDSSADTSAGSTTLTLQVRVTCDSRVTWTVAGQSPQIPPRADGNADDAVCTDGEVQQADDGQYRVVVLSANASTSAQCTWTPPQGVTLVDALVVGGGGGGGADAGGGGGGGGVVHHSALQVSGTYSITVGAGGAGGASAPSPQFGDDGAASMIQDASTDLLVAEGGLGGGNCGWTGSGCGANDGGTGGGSSGSALSESDHRNGGNGGDGTWNGFRVGGNQGGRAGQAGVIQQSGLSSVEYSCGGGGAGAGFAPAAGGCGNAGTGAYGSSAPDAAEPGTGAGGGGGDSGAGGNGGSGIVILRYSLPLATNDPQVTASWTISGEAGPSDLGTALRQVADWTSTDGCAANWVSQSGSATTSPDDILLTRGFCYRWTLDTHLDSDATAPVDTADFTPTVNLTSPPLIIPAEVTLTVPERIMVDPRAVAVLAPGVVISDPGSVGTVAVCVTESADATLSGIGQTTSSPSVLFGFGPGAAGSGATLEGEGGNALKAVGTIGQVETALAGFQIVRPGPGPVHFDGTVNILFRVMPVIAGLTSSCEPGGTGIGPMASGTRLMHVIPLGLGTSYRTPVPIGRQ